MSVSTFQYGNNHFVPPIMDQQRIEERAKIVMGQSTDALIAKTLDTSVLIRASEEADGLLKSLKRRMNTCVNWLIGGSALSVMTQNPLPLLIGLSECFPTVRAQQKIGSEFQVNTYTNLSQASPSAASLNNGNFVVTWRSEGQDGSSSGIFGQLFNGNGTKVRNEFQVNSYTTNSQFSPSVTSFSNDNFVVTWTSDGQDGHSWGVYGQLFNGNGAKIGNEFRVNSYTTNFQGSPSVTSFSNGNFVVTWYSNGQDGSGTGVYGQLFNGNGAKIGNEFLVNSYTTNSQVSPSVTSFSNGNFVVTWDSEGQDGSSWGIFGQLFDGNGAKIGNEFQINSYTTNSQGATSVSSLSNGNLVVTWSSDGQDGSSRGIFGQLFDGNCAKIGNEFQINSYTTNSQWISSISGFSNGNFVVTWHSDGQDGSGDGIFSQLFDENGTKVGNEFKVNSYTNNSQRSSSVTSLSNSNFVVTWVSDGQDGDSGGVYGQIFHDNITYPLTSSTTSSSTSSTTSSTSSSTTSTTSSSTTSSSTSSTNPSSSSTKSSSTTSSSRSTSLRSSSETSKAMSSTSPPSNKRLLWLWLLLGIGGAFCLGGIGYLFKRSKDEQEDDDVPPTELETRKQPDHVIVEGDYLRTPNFVTAKRESDYLRTPDHVSPEDGRQYGRGPDAPSAEGDYLRTPDHVTQLRV